MNRVQAVPTVTNPKDRGEQVDSSAAFILDNTEYYDALRNRPNRVSAAAVRLVADKVYGYHFMVISAALRQYNATGVLDGSEPVFTHEELYGS